MTKEIKITNIKTKNRIKILLIKFWYLVLFCHLCFGTCHSIAIAAELSGTNYAVKDGVFGYGGFMGDTSDYGLKDILGDHFIGSMQSALYSLRSAFFNINDLPLATISNYNSGQSIEDETPTFIWVYSDVDDDSQKRYQLQVARDFAAPVADTGIVYSDATSYTSGILHRTGGMTGYQWRVRVFDGFDWSGWSVASSGFVLTAGGFMVAEFGALTQPGGEEILQSIWQRDNDPYFYWTAPEAGLEVLGYSFSLDEPPDEIADTAYTYYQFLQDSIIDGKHSCYVKAQRTSGIWGESAAFDIWVDSSAPTFNNLVPVMGTLISDDQPQVKATLSDAASGVDADTIEMEINRISVSAEYDLESGEVFYQPDVPFPDGEIIVFLLVSDLVGNESLPLAWSFVIDTVAPSGSLLINNDDEMTNTNLVTLSITAQDDTTDVVEMMLSNDGVFDTETWESYTSLRRNWVLPAISGMRKVYAMVKDEAGNVGDMFFDEIDLEITAPDTYILSGPGSIIQEQNAQLTFRGSLTECRFSYKFDNDDWSDWSDEFLVNKSELSEGNHYFMVKAAKDLNQDGLLQLNEVDPTPALWVWTVSFSGALQPSTEPERPIIRWEEE